LTEKYDEEQNARIRADKTIRDLENELEETKEKVEDAAHTAQLEELKQRQEQEIELMRFKLERESDLRKKADEAAAAFKAQYEQMLEKFEEEARQREKTDKTRVKTQDAVTDLEQRLEQERKKRETAEKEVKRLKGEVQMATSTAIAGKVDSKELKDIQVASSSRT